MKSLLVSQGAFFGYGPIATAALIEEVGYEKGYVLLVILKSKIT